MEKSGFVFFLYSIDKLKDIFYTNSKSIDKIITRVRLFANLLILFVPYFVYDLLIFNTLKYDLKINILFGENEPGNVDSDERGVTLVFIQL